MKKIVFLHVSSILGGSERSFLDLVEKVASADRNKFLVIVPSDGPLLSELKKRTPEISYVIEPLPSLFERGSRKAPVMTLLLTLLSIPSILYYTYQLKRTIEEFRPDLIYTNGIKCHLLSLALKKRLPVPVVWHMQDYFPELNYVRLFLKFIKTAPELVICNSNSVNVALKKITPSFWSTRIETVHNSVDLEQFNMRHRKTNHPVVISMVGMITPWKGQDVFIEAIHRIIQRNPHLPFHAQIVGGEAYSTQGEVGFKKQLEAKVLQLGLTDKISFLGLIEDIEKIYNTSDIVAHCSKKPEPFGRVIIEAMASGCSVIATRAGGVTEIITDSIDGFLVTPESSEELGLAIEKLILNPDLRNSFAKAGRKTVEQKFSADFFSKTVFSYLEKVV